MKKLSLLLFVFLLVGCSSAPSEGDIQTAVAGTRAVEETAQANVYQTLTAQAPTATDTPTATNTPQPATSTPTPSRTPSPTATPKPVIKFVDAESQLSEWMEGAEFGYVYTVNNQKTYEAIWLSGGVFAYISTPDDENVSFFLISLPEGPLYDAEAQVQFIQKLVTKYVSGEAFQWIVDNFPDEQGQSLTETFDSPYGIAGMTMTYAEEGKYTFAILFRDAFDD